MASKIGLTPEVLSNFQVANVFSDPATVNQEKPITSISFDDTGEFCVTAGDDDSLNVYSCLNGTLQSTVYSKKYGVTLARYTHHKNNVVYASTKENDTLRYLSLHDNKYIRYFHGHEKRVTGVAVSSNDDTLLTSSLDNTVRLWDLRTPKCQGVFYGDGNALVAIDAQALVFAIAINSYIIKLYDYKEQGRGPFAIWTKGDIQSVYGKQAAWTSIKFTSDGKKLVITTVSDMIYILDAFDGTWLQTLVGNAGPNRLTSGEEVTTCPNAQFVLAGGRDGCIRIWNIGGPRLDDKPYVNQAFHTTYSPHKTPITMMGFNPTYGLFASGSTELAFWLPPPKTL